MSLTLGPCPGIRIAGAATAWPSDLRPHAETRLTNDEVYAHLFGDQWRTLLGDRGHDPARPLEWGVREREWSRDVAVGSVELGVVAARRALERADVTPDRLDLVLAATCTPPSVTSSVAARITRELDSRAAAQDVRAGGAAGLAAWTQAAAMHQHGCSTSLVVATECISPYLGAHDLGNALLFGDGAAALVLTSDGGGGGLVGAVAGSAAVGGTSFTVPGRLPPVPGEAGPDDFRFRAPDAEYLDGVASVWARAGEALRSDVPSSSELDVFIPYAVTRAQAERAARPFGVAPTRALEVLASHGCPGCAAPLVATVRAVEQGDLEQGALLGALAVGGGVSWAGLVWRGA